MAAPERVSQPCPARCSCRDVGPPDDTFPDDTADAGDHAADFATFFSDSEPRLRHALVARLGTDRGRDAAAEALAWAYEHWGDVRRMSNPVGYLYRVGASRTRPRKTVAPARIRPVVIHEDPVVEPALRSAVERLSPNQRVAVVLRAGHGWTLDEIATLTGTSISSVNTHYRRGMVRLRAALGAEVPA